MPFQPEIHVYSNDSDEFVSLLTDTSEKAAERLYAASPTVQVSSSRPSRAALEDNSNQTSYFNTEQVVIGMVILTVGTLLARSWRRNKFIKPASEAEKEANADQERQLIITKR